MKKREMRAKIHGLEKDLLFLMTAVGELAVVVKGLQKKVVELKDEVSALRRRRLTEEEISDVADRVNRLLTEDK